jgi:glycerol-3-phosphate dehydrogenase
MTRDLGWLARTRHDILVIGGGIYGVCIAWDAALRGLSVALVEKEDFGHGTSSNTLRVIHGGLRYLKSGDFLRFRRSLRERMVFMRIAPHLVRSLPFLIPTYGQLGRSKALLALAHHVHELVRFDRPRPGDTRSGLPSGRVLSRGECLRLFPGLDHPRITGAVIIFDGQMVSSENLLIAILRSAAAAGAQVANYVEAVSFLRQSNRVTGITARDVLSGSVFEVQARAVVNASGPWSGAILALANGGHSRGSVAFSKAFNVLVERALTGDHALGISFPLGNATEEPWAGIDTGMLFLTPWQGRTLIGTAHLPSGCDPNDVRVPDAELEALLREINRGYPAAAVTPDEVSFRYAGLLPVLEGGGRPPVRLLRRYAIRDHRREGLESLISVVGVKFTEARLVAEKTVDLLVKKLGRPARACATTTTVVHGAETPDALDSLVAEALVTVPEAGVHRVRRLVVRYGSAASEVLKCVDTGRSGLAEADRLLAAEVRHAIREEMAQRLTDIVLRRTELGFGRGPSVAALEIARATMGEELGWDAMRTERELAALKSALAARRCGTVG